MTIPDRWTDEAVGVFRSLWADGLSAAEIAVALNDKCSTQFSRNAVLGKANRIKLSSPRGSGRRKSGKSSRPNRDRPSYVPTVRKVVTRLRQINPGGRYDYSEAFEYEPISQLSADDIPLAQRKQLLELGPEDCRWPYGDPGKSGFFFCGAVKSSGRSYCAYHARVGCSPNHRHRQAV